MSDNQEGPALERVTLKQFFETVPPGKRVFVTDLADPRQSQLRVSYFVLRQPELQLHCTNSNCNGVRFFGCQSNELTISLEKLNDEFVTYICRNCRKSYKTFAMLLVPGSEGKTGEAYKYGELPPFGPPTPSRLVSLLGSEREYFFKGRRAENQGLGIAAFAYYRRVIEHQKNKVFDEILRVSEKLSAPSELLDQLRNAKRETQFSKGIELIKHGIPETLLINGHNPLTLLHSALSEGIHAQSDEECLSLATCIRVVLTELAENLAGALKQEAEIDAAVSTLLNAAAKKSRKPPEDS